MGLRPTASAESQTLAKMGLGSGTSTAQPSPPIVLPHRALGLPSLFRPHRSPCLGPGWCEIRRWVEGPAADQVPLARCGVQCGDWDTCLGPQAKFQVKIRQQVTCPSTETPSGLGLTGYGGGGRYSAVPQLFPSHLQGLSHFQQPGARLPEAKMSLGRESPFYRPIS